MWLKKMINQAVRGSFECYVNADKVVTDVDHVTEVNEDIMNMDNSINMNSWALNEEMRFDLKFKEKLPVEEKIGENQIYKSKAFHNISRLRLRCNF
jgi:hypothetical protein